VGKGRARPLLVADTTTVFQYPARVIIKFIRFDWILIATTAECMR
jgi:hypothetical protein